MGMWLLSYRTKILKYVDISKIYFLILLTLLVFWMCFGNNVLAYVGLGGYRSEKLVGRSGVSDSSLVISRGTEMTVIATGVAMETLEATNVSFTTGTLATLRGQITNLNGWPNVTVYFEWGYSSSLGNTTPSVTMIATGEYNYNLTGYDAEKTVYYRMVVEADVYQYGDIKTFVLYVPDTTADNFIRVMFPVALAATFLIVPVWWSFKNRNLKLSNLLWYIIQSMLIYKILTTIIPAFLD